MKRFLDMFKTQYRLVEVNAYYKYETQQKPWYSFGRWITVEKSRSDSLNIAKQQFRNIAYGPFIIQSSIQGEDEVY